MSVGIELPATGPGTRPGILDTDPQQDCPASGGQGKARIWESRQSPRHGCKLPGVERGASTYFAFCIGHGGGGNSRFGGVWYHCERVRVSNCLSQALQAELRGAAERVDALLAFGEGLAERSEPRAWASLERVLRALGTHRDTIFQRLWQLQAQLISYSLVGSALVAPSPGPNPPTPLTSILCSRCLRRPTSWTRTWKLRETLTGQHLVESGGPGHLVPTRLLQSWNGTQQGMLGVLGPQGKRYLGYQEFPVSCVATGDPRAADRALR